MSYKTEASIVLINDNDLNPLVKDNNLSHRHTIDRLDEILIAILSFSIVALKSLNKFKIAQIIVFKYAISR